MTGSGFLSWYPLVTLLSQIAANKIGPNTSSSTELIANTRQKDFTPW